MMKNKDEQDVLVITKSKVLLKLGYYYMSILLRLYIVRYLN